MFPSDNSVIMAVKNQSCGKRMGESQIIKDNFVFGLNEKKEVHKSKVEGEDVIRNRDAKKFSDNRADFWLIFDNGTRLYVEMADSR